MRPVYLLTAVIAAAFTTQVGAPQALAQTPKVVMEEMMVPSEPGIEIYVRNKRPADMTAFRPERTLLFVHGATYPAHTSFDLKLDGVSWMDYIAARGYDVYLLDIRGYGKSTRPRGDGRQTRRQCADRARRHRRQGYLGGRRFHSQAPQHPAPQPVGLVVGDHADGDLHHARTPARSSASRSMRRRGFERRHRSRGRPARSAPTARSRASRRRAAG